MEPKTFLTQAFLELTKSHSSAPAKVNVAVADCVYDHPDVYNKVKEQLLVHTCNHDHDTIEALVSLFDFLDCIHDDLQPITCAMFASFDNVLLLEHFFKKDFAWDECTIISAVIHNGPRCFQFALENKCPIHCSSYNDLIRYVLSNGSLQCLQVLTQYMVSTTSDVDVKYPKSYWQCFVDDTDQDDMKQHLLSIESN